MSVKYPTLRSNLSPEEITLLLSIANCPESVAARNGGLEKIQFNAKERITYLDETSTTLMTSFRLVGVSPERRKDTVIGLKFNGLIVGGSEDNDEVCLTINGLITALKLMNKDWQSVAKKAEQDWKKKPDKRTPRIAPTELNIDHPPSSPDDSSTPQGKVPSPLTHHHQVMTDGLEEKVSLIAENPKRPNSASHVRYQLWKIGMTRDDAIKAGLTKADITYDVKKGYVKFG